MENLPAEQLTAAQDFAVGPGPTPRTYALYFTGACITGAAVHDSFGGIFAYVYNARLR